MALGQWISHLEGQVFRRKVGGHEVWGRVRMAILKPDRGKWFASVIGSCADDPTHCYLDSLEEGKAWVEARLAAAVADLERKAEENGNAKEAG